VRDKVPPEVEAALQKALARVPADRFATVGEFATALDVMDTMGRRREASPPFLATLGKWKWAIAAVLAVVLGVIIIASRPAPLVADLYVVLPFRHRDGAAPRLLNGNACQQLLYDALTQWNGLKLVDGMRASDAKRRHADGPLEVPDAITTAKSLGAGKLIWGEVSQAGADISVLGKLYDVKTGSTLRQFTVHVDSSLSNAESKFAELADSLILPKTGSPAVDMDSRGTRNIPALVDYTAAHEALGQWQLAKAESLFRESASADPGFANAHFWLAQVMSWRNSGELTEWRETADRANALRAQLGARDSARAIALNALARSDYPDACARYKAMTERDTLDFVAWYGLGDCRRRDRLVVPDAKSPSGYAFRSSYQSAINAYDRALRIVPSVHLAFAGLGYERLSQLLFTQSTQLRRGFALTPDTVWFLGSARSAGDTMAIIPYRFADVTAGHTDTADANGVMIVNRERLLAIARSWKNAYPHSPSAYETLARALESTGNVTGSNDPSQSALAAIDSARALAHDREDSVRTGVVYVRVLLEGSRWAEARAAADAVLALAGDASPREADQVKVLAALTGKTKRVVDLLRRSAVDYKTLTAEGRELTPPLPVSMSARALLGFVVMGGPADSIMRLEQQVGQLVQGNVPPPMRATVRNAVLLLPAQIAFPLRPAVTFTPPVPVPGDIGETQAAFARGDSAKARALLRATIAADAKMLPSELTLDVRYQYAWLAAASGDSAGAAALIDHGLNALTSYGQFLLDNVQTPASLVRMMALRADLAARAGDARTARQWASAAATLWAAADPDLDPMLAHLRALAAP
jgi:tetratricopeptide (TPR) repeat protein